VASGVRPMFRAVIDVSELKTELSPKTSGTQYSGLSQWALEQACCLDLNLLLTILIYLLTGTQAELRMRQIYLTDCIHREAALFHWHTGS
jgi:hypothetical protein